LAYLCKKGLKMLVVREFEILNKEGNMLAIPCDMEGATFGENLEDSIESAADWLYETALDCLANNKDIEGGELGHQPTNGGMIVVVAVDCNLSRVAALTAADAARALGVSPARVAQMCESKLLLSWKDGTKRMVATQSVEARLKETPRPGRPRKNTNAPNIEALIQA
jgi:hypothetical protein